nr:hypothetical protein NG677_03935 [Methylobacterium sp. OTU13CASTA1]
MTTPQADRPLILPPLRRTAKDAEAFARVVHAMVGAPFQPNRAEFSAPVSPIVDAVAEALFEADATIHDFKIAWSDVGDYRRFCYRMRAKAALAAMRNPPEAVLGAIHDKVRIECRPDERTAYILNADEMWAAGIDAALAVPEEGREP